MVLQLPTADKMSAPASPRVPKREQLTRELLPLNCCHFSAAVKNTLLQVIYETWTRLVGIKSCQTKAWMTFSEEREALMFV